MDVGSRRRRQLCGASALVASSVVAACGFGGETGDTDPVGGGVVTATASVPATLPLAEQALDDPDVTTVATDLAPSQTGASTVPAPATPDPCAARDVEIWTAQVAPDGSSAVIRMRNASDEWCEPDIGRSPRLDPAIEPDVWLLPGGTADVIVAERDVACTGPAVVDEVQIGVGNESVLVPSALLVCDWWLTAFYPNDDVGVTCELADLESAATASAVVLRNASATPCDVGGLVAVDGAEATSEDALGPAVHALFPGDVVAYGRPDETDCGSDPGRVVLLDEAVGEIEVSGVPCSVVFDIGSPRPWYGTDVGPPAGPPGGADATAFLVALDPFGAGQ